MFFVQVIARVAVDFSRESQFAHPASFHKLCTPFFKLQIYHNKRFLSTKFYFLQRLQAIAQPSVNNILIAAEV